MSMNFDELRSLVRHRRVGFVRDLKSEVTALDDGSILVLTRLLDEHHDIATIMLVNNELCITEFAAHMERMPYPVCRETEAAYDKLKGLYVFKRGVTKDIRAAVERTCGCTHITELVEAGLRALFAGLYNVRRQGDLSKVINREESRQLNILRPVLGDTCRSFRRQDADDAVVQVALDKIRQAGYDTERLDPHRSVS